MPIGRGLKAICAGLGQAAGGTPEAALQRIKAWKAGRCGVLAGILNPWHAG